MGAYLSLLGVALAARAALSATTVVFVSPGQAWLWSWPLFGALLLATLAGAALARRAGIPPPVDPAIPNDHRFALPALWGSVVAALAIVSDVLDPVAAARGVPTVHVGFPASLPFYVYGAILIGVLFHFLPVAAAAWLLDRFHLRSRWAIAVAVAVLGLSEDGGWFLRNGLPLSIEAARHLLSYAANVTELLFVWNFGLLGGLSQRLATYFWWHLVWGALD